MEESKRNVQRERDKQARAALMSEKKSKETELFSAPVRVSGIFL